MNWHGLTHDSFPSSIMINSRWGILPTYSFSIKFMELDISNSVGIFLFRLNCPVVQRCTLSTKTSRKNLCRQNLRGDRWLPKYDTQECEQVPGSEFNTQKIQIFPIPSWRVVNISQWTNDRSQDHQGYLFECRCPFL